MSGQNSYAIKLLRKNLESSILQELTQITAGLSITEAPTQTGFDYGLNLSAVAKQLGMPPNEIASRLSKAIPGKDTKLIEEVGVIGPFLNFKVNMSEFGDLVIGQILEYGADFGRENEGKGKRVVIDMSSPNIAKRMSYGHLRSTIIGDALANLYRTQGYEVIRDNHIGDWGTQFGKLIVAFKNWGNERELISSPDPIGILQDLYIRFHTEADGEKEKLCEEAMTKINKEGYESVPGLSKVVEQLSQEIMTRKRINRTQLDMTRILEDALDRVIESSLEKDARKWFLKLEDGNPEARRLWKLCVDLSIKEFNQIYALLGVGFESSLGESFYENQLKNVIDIVSKSKAGKISAGALVIDMTDKGLGVAMVQKSDGASLYLTRDLACAIYRQEKIGADKVVYVVGEEQKEYFQQLFEALRRLGYKIGDNAEHVYFGMVSLPEGKMSTRKGRTILLKDVINEGLKRAQEILQEKNPELNRNKTLRDKVVRQIAIGALKWNDLSQDAKRSIVFDWAKALNFDGYAAPYVQYSAVRAKSILETGGVKKDQLKSVGSSTENVYENALERALIRQLAEFPNAIKDALGSNSPAKIATYVFELARRFNTFYAKMRVLKAENRALVDSRLKLVAATFQVINNSLAILGIEVPEKM